MLFRTNLADLPRHKGLNMMAEEGRAGNAAGIPPRTEGFVP